MTDPVKFIRTFRVQYRIDDKSPQEATNVTLTDGYTGLGDIVRILAVLHFSSNAQEYIDRIEVTDANMVGKIKVVQ